MVSSDNSLKEVPEEENAYELESEQDSVFKRRKIKFINNPENWLDSSFDGVVYEDDFTIIDDSDDVVRNCSPSSKTLWQMIVNSFRSTYTKESFKQMMTEYYNDSKLLKLYVSFMRCTKDSVIRKVVFFSVSAAIVAALVMNFVWLVSLMP